MPVCMSICVAATSTATPFQPSQSSPGDKLATAARRKPLMLVDNQSQSDANVPVVNSSPSSTDVAAAGCCVIGGRVRLRPDAVYAQLGDVDAPGARCMRIVHIGDAFCRKRRGGTVELAGRVPDGDVLVHSGCDFGSILGGSDGGSGGNRDSLRNRLGSLLTPLLRRRELRRLCDLLSTLPHRHKILVPGCETGLSQKELQQLVGPSCHCLRDSSVTLEGVTFYGLSTSSTAPTEDSQGEKPADLDTVDVLVSHSPPRDQELAREVFQRIRPKAMLQGHSLATESEGAQWQDGVLLSNGRLANGNDEKGATPGTGKRDLNKPVVIDFYTCRPMSGISEQYSEVMQTVGSNHSRMKKQPNYSECNLL